MGDTNESSSETDHIRIIDISDFPDSPHLFNKKAYKFTLAVFGATNYRERIGFNLYPLPSGHYTMVAEFFPPVLRNVSVTAAIGAGSISGQVSTIVQPHGSTRRYVKILVQLENVRTGLGTNHIYFDLHGDLLQEINLDVRMVVYGVNVCVDQAYVVNNGRMALQTDLDLHGHRLNGQGGLSFDSGGVISLHDDLNTNGYRVVGKNGGGFEVDDNGRTKLHEDLDLNGHGLTGTLTFNTGRILLQKGLDVGRHPLYGTLQDFDGKCVMENGGKVEVHFANDSTFKIIPFRARLEFAYFYYEKPLDSYPAVQALAYFEPLNSERVNSLRINSTRGNTHFQFAQPIFSNYNEAGAIRVELVGKFDKCPDLKINVTVRRVPPLSP